MFSVRPSSRLSSIKYLSAVHSLRVASPSIRAFHIQQQRNFASTPRKDAQPTQNNNVVSAIALDSPLFKELAGNTEAVESMKKLIMVLQEEGMCYFVI